MGLFNFGNKASKKETERTVYKMIVDRGNGFYSWNGKLYQSDIVRACIKPRTKAIGKCVAKHIRTTEVKTEDGTQKKVEINPLINIRFLLEEPNGYMTGQMLQEKVANQLSLNGNAFIYIMRDTNGLPVGLYPVPASTVEAKYDENGELWLKFYYDNGKNDLIRYTDIIHIRDDYYSNDLFGDCPQEALSSVMDCVNLSDQGMKNAIKNSAVVRWILKFTQALRPEDMKEATKQFADDYLGIDKEGSIGVAATDSKADAVQVTPHDYVPNAAQTDRQVNRIYAYFNVNEKIVHSTYTEDEWISYYEQAVEPIAAQMAREYTRKLFSRLERSRGNAIVFESSALTFASMKTKLNLVQFVDRGIMTPNEVRGYLNLVPIEGGDSALLRKDTGIFGEDPEGGDMSEGN
ncbi:MAG: phage portal protein [Lachnospiraceae bacterium]|jgi:HK97 family phage portal protein|nr:phage portal protein [Lachnospiraceae bacterium]